MRSIHRRTRALVIATRCNIDECPPTLVRRAHLIWRGHDPVIGLLISNFVIVLVSSVGFVSSQTRERVYVAFGAVAGVFSLVVGAIFVFGLDGDLPDLGAVLPF